MVSSSSSLRSRRRATETKCIQHSLRILPTVDHRPHKLVIAHRGASYYMPEHTLAAYRLALELGADFVEPDIVATADRQLVAIHSVDLNVTTNVVEIYANERKPWYSSYMKREGYWSFNFTYDEISKLRVRQRLPEGRSTAYDDLFKVPSLVEIVEELNGWNENELPKTLMHTTEVVYPKGEKPVMHGEDPSGEILRKPSVLELHKAGIYLELKDYGWLKEEADIDLVDLMFEHFTQYSFEWDWAMPCFQGIEYNMYKVPGLVVQSFDLGSLQRFHERWLAEKDSKSVPEPPYVMLADIEQCQQESFWSNAATMLKDIVSGVGPDKRCLIPQNKSVSGQETITFIMARKMNLAIHPWTERPEKNFFDPRFESAVEETNFLLYQVGVDGIFTESVSTVVTAAKLGDPWAPAEDNGPHYCYSMDKEVGIYVGLSLFILGCCCAGVLYLTGRGLRDRDGDPEVQPIIVKGPSEDGGGDPFPPRKDSKNSVKWSAVLWGLGREPLSQDDKDGDGGTLKYEDDPSITTSTVKSRSKGKD